MISSNLYRFLPIIQLKIFKTSCKTLQNIKIIGNFHSFIALKKERRKFQISTQKKRHFSKIQTNLNIRCLSAKTVVEIKENERESMRSKIPSQFHNHNITFILFQQCYLFNQFVVHIFSCNIKKLFFVCNLRRKYAIESD